MSDGQRKYLQCIPKATLSEYLRDRSKPKDYSKKEGIEVGEIERRKAAGECLRCAWPADRKGTHQVKDCIRPIKLDTGTAAYSKVKGYQKPVGPEADSEAETSVKEESSSNEE